MKDRNAFEGFGLFDPENDFSFFVGAGVPFARQNDADGALVAPLQVNVAYGFQRRP